MSDSARSPASRQGKALALALFLLIVLTVGGLNAHYLFHAELHEHGDLAANSLAIREAKHFQRLTGQYSRWGFSHPGPGWFYAMAAGEALFHDTLRLTPTPWNAQLLAVLLINGAFLAATLVMVARGATSGTADAPDAPRLLAVTVAVACLLVGILLLAALGETAGLTDGWTPHLMVIPFACLVIAAASVASGRGADLPVLTLSGAALLHSHVAQPLFVIPMVGLAWLGLAAGHRGRPWRAFPRAHVVALVVVAFTALPVALDAIKGADSNLALILAHRRTHPGIAHSWADAGFYCLRFAGYTPLAGREISYPGGTTGEIVRGYVSRHAPILLVWTFAATLLAVGAWRRRFGACLLASASVALGLAVYWARIQDGPLLYFNSWFLYGWLLAVSFGAAAALARILAAVFPRLARSPWSAVGLALCAASLFTVKVERFRTHTGDDAPSRNVVPSVSAALAADATDQGGTRYLAFPEAAWEDAAAVALELDRRDESWCVHPDWALVFGRSHGLAGGPLAALRSAGDDGLRVWHVRPRSSDPTLAPVAYPLFHGGSLRADSPVVDPTAGTTLFFTGPRLNASDYVLEGWNSPSPGDPTAWSELPEGLMSFRAPPVSGADVEMVVDAFPALTPGRVDAQRLTLVLNDHPLGAWTVREDAPIRVRIPAAVWNERRDALLVWRFPDAASPARLHPGESLDDRQLAFGFRSVRFSVVTP